MTATELREWITVIGCLLAIPGSMWFVWLWGKQERQQRLDTERTKQADEFNAAQIRSYQEKQP